MTKARFLPAAEAEFLEEVAYYSNLGEGLGIRFQFSVLSAVTKASENPLGGAPSHKGTRSRLVKGFPFSIFYRASADELLIVAVGHHRRRPEYWFQRIK